MNAYDLFYPFTRIDQIHRFTIRLIKLEEDNDDINFFVHMVWGDDMQMKMIVRYNKYSYHKFNLIKKIYSTVNNANTFPVPGSINADRIIDTIEEYLKEKE